jgi:hypothetical protein
MSTRPQGPFPLIVVQLRDRVGVHTFQAAAGRAAELPIAIGRDADDQAQTITVELDPAALIDA